MTDKKLQEEALEPNNEKRQRRSLLRDTRGLNTVEYAILLVLIVVVSYAGWKQFGKQITDGLDNANNTIDIHKVGKKK